jgi:membrane-bound serine protease (ClpP class)
MMNFLLEPNVAYLILLGGVMLGFLALVTPGTGLFEVGAFFCIALAAYAVYNLSFNWWALVLLVLSVVPFVYAIQKPKREVFLALSILLLVVGSVFVFPSQDQLFAVNPLVVLLASILVISFLWIAVRKSVEAAGIRPSHNLEGLLGQLGEARTDVHEDGSVQVAGELWSARSVNLIRKGSPVRIVSRDGFVVVVEQVSQANS